MFDPPIVQFSAKLRGGFDAAGAFTDWGLWVAKVVATAGLIFVILHSPPGKASALVTCYVGTAYWFTASTSFCDSRPRAFAACHALAPSTLHPAALWLAA